MLALNYTTRRVMASSGGPPGQMPAINISATSARTSARARAPTTSPTGTSSRGPGWAAASTGPDTRPNGNGNLLDGGWERGRRHGVFIFTFPNGARYQTLYRGGARQGGWTEIDPVPHNPEFFANRNTQ